MLLIVQLTVVFGSGSSGGGGARCSARQKLAGEKQIEMVGGEVS